MSGMLVVDQRAGARALQPWVLNGAGAKLPGHDHDMRLAELRAGLARHPGVRTTGAPDADGGPALEEVLRALHDPDYLCALAGVDGEEPVLMERYAAPGMAPDTPVSAGIARAAFEGVRTAIAAAQAIVGGERFAYALCRPPGHHAGPGWLGGCCYLNNAAAAAHALRSGGVARVAILDLDIHYPNGTAAIAAGMAGTTLYSLHSWPVVNVPTRSARPCCERERIVEFREAPAEEQYLRAVAEAVEVIVGADDGADAIVLSLGYDTVRGDPHGCWRFAPEIFVEVGRLLAGSRLPVCVVQEGGYALESLAECGHAFARGLLWEEGR